MPRHRIGPDLSRILPGFITRLAAAIVCLRLIGCAAGGPVQLVSQNQSSPEQSAPADIAKQPNYRQVIVSVESNGKTPPPKLTAKDLRLYQDGKQLAIAYFQPQASAVAILVDTSGSMERKLPICRSALEDFINKLNPSDEIWLLAFSDRPFLLATPTTARATVIEHLSLFHAYGRTALYDSLLDVMILLSRSSLRNKAVLLITDGIDDASAATVKQVEEKAKKNKILIYSIGVGNPQNPQRSYWSADFSDSTDASYTKPLKAMAKDSDGETFVARLNDHGEALKRATTAIADKIGNRYIVGFIGDGSANQLRIDAPQYPHLSLAVAAAH